MEIDKKNYGIGRHMILEINNAHVLHYIYT